MLLLLFLYHSDDRREEELRDAPGILRFALDDIFYFLNSFNCSLISFIRLVDKG
jgi:hypothetical protein